MVRRGSTVRVRQRASRNPCTAPTLRNPNRKRLGRAGTRGRSSPLPRSHRVWPFQREPGASTSSAYERIQGMTLIGILVLIAIIWLLVVLLGGLPTWLLLLLIVL